MARLTGDSAGNLYGTTAYGGDYGSGTAFKLDSGDNFTVLHSFGATAEDGAQPFAPLVLGRDGNLYGTTASGGIDCGSGDGGCGTVFQLTPSGNETVLHYFDGGEPSSSDGIHPYAGFIALRGSNAMAGTTSAGFNGSVAYEITPAGTETVLAHQTSPNFYGSLVQDASGDLWGTTGGGHLLCEGGCGSIVRLHRTASGWIANTTYNFTGKGDGGNPSAGLVYDGLRHVFYGVAPYGGAEGYGVLFELDSTGTKLTVLHNFDFETDGAYPTQNLTIDPLGDVYGVTPGGGPDNQGTVFVYTILGQFATLHTFTSSAGTPAGSLLLDWKKMTLYGTTFWGGDPDCQCGVIYSIRP
jgi:uncharacterized repeat protein (TIGR03803 family)